MGETKYIKVRDCIYYSRANGRSFFNIKCPFCNSQIIAYTWSLSGVGKKCPDCGAKVIMDLGRASFEVSKTNKK